MKVPSTRPTLAVGVLYGHACFNSWYECLVDYALWQTAFARNLSRDEYFAYLGCFVFIGVIIGILLALFMILPVPN